MRSAGFRKSIVLAAALATFGDAHAAAPAVAPAPAASASGASRPLVDACPAQLTVKQTISDTIAGWTPLNQEGGYPFTRVEFFPGPPAETSLVVPTLEFKGQAGLHDAWDLPHRNGGYWMTCAYANTTATVARKLADDADYCQADYDGRFTTLVVKHWSCGVKRTMAPPVWSRAAQGKGVKPAAKNPARRNE